VTSKQQPWASPIDEKKKEHVGEALPLDELGSRYSPNAAGASRGVTQLSPAGGETDVKLTEAAGRTI
jgi:hypothetical protein